MTFPSGPIVTDQFPKLVQTRSARLAVDLTSTATFPVFSLILSVPITTREGTRLQVYASIDCNCFVLPIPIIFRVLLDGTPLQNWTSNVSIVINESSRMVLEEPVVGAVGAGAHTVDFEWSRFSAGSVPTCSPVTFPDFHNANLVVQEVVSP